MTRIAHVLISRPACFFVWPGSDGKRLGRAGSGRRVKKKFPFTPTPIPGGDSLSSLFGCRTLTRLSFDLATAALLFTMGDFNTEAFTLLAVAIVIIALRTVARWIMVGPKNFQADDYLMVLACVSDNDRAEKRRSLSLL